jgi:AraC-like DNA-binding protein
MLSQAGNASDPAAIQRIPPDGTVEIIVHLGEPFAHVEGAAVRRQPAGMVVGVWTGAIGLAAPQSFDTIGIRLRPGAASAFWREPASAFTNTVVDLDTVWGRSAAALRERLGETAAAAGRLAVIETFLTGQALQTDRALDGPLGRIAATGGRVSVDQLARNAGVSARQLERAFRAHVGVAPKTFSRIVRFQRVLRRVSRTPGTWADAAIACGYTDQSHLIRDVTQFAGETPTALAASSDAIADYFRRL